MPRRFAAAVLLLLAGCAAVRRPPTTPAALLAQGDGAGADYRAAVDTLVARLADRAARRGDRTLDVLLLSGGGQNGAYGAGFLRGWAERGDAPLPLPRFDLVTGISTGALQGAFALLGTRAALDTMSALYRNAADAFAPKLDWLFWLRRTGGVVRTDAYARTIRDVVDPDMRGALEAAFLEGRQYAVATADLDLGTGRLWDVRRELAVGPGGAERLHAVLYAATAIPGVFPPRLIDGHVHADGGVAGNLLPVLGLDDYRALGRALRARGVAGDVTVRTWVVVNFWTHAPPRAVDPSRRNQVSGRANLMMLWAHQADQVARLHELARAVTADVPGLRLEVRHTAIPVALSMDPAASRLFDRAFMARLDSAGFARGRAGDAWDPVPTPYARPAAP
ncbi:patatin-like phospholipase family protein [Roseisolibacter sp. H3M3-2]|uniref:patatin-like phospholipase family protein n=1 Tax=Roseisolibacter sp. H3M3-2 TaxID=3031323 RepID=UPI0023DC0BAA|nr:patatin-like phospholipase family protein [Roseisolibacter sp. H3M3-2]MDF1501933.1 patatin-like phospholipase family protein [Roseisolibacter sp. H3M3-2]